MHVLIEITRSEMEDMEMSEDYQVSDFVESLLSNSLTITQSNVEVTADVVIKE